MGRGSKTPTYMKALAILAVLMFGLFAIDYAGLYDVPFFGTATAPEPGPGPGQEQPAANTPSDYPTAIITTDVAAWDALDISTARTISTDINALWFVYRGGWIKLASGDAQDITISSADNNIVYLAVEFPSSPSYYVDYEKILTMNPHLSFYSYEDITGDDIEEFVFKVSLTGSTYASATGKWNMPQVNIYILTYDSSFTVPSGGQQADLSGVGEATTTQYLKWYTEISAEKKGIAIYKVVLNVNTSDISKVTLKKLNIPGVGYLDGSSFTQDVLTSSTKWTYTISNNLLYGAEYLKRPVNDPNEFKFTTAVELNLATNDTLTFTLYIYELTPGEASVSDSDAVNVDEA
jgi:hypothetical protein